jgi:hypothetical protein
VEGGTEKYTIEGKRLFWRTARLEGRMVEIEKEGDEKGQGTHKEKMAYIKRWTGGARGRK